MTLAFGEIGTPGLMQVSKRGGRSFRVSQLQVVTWRKTQKRVDKMTGARRVSLNIALIRPDSPGRQAPGCLWSLRMHLQCRLGLVVSEQDAPYWLSCQQEAFQFRLMFRQRSQILSGPESDLCSWHTARH